MADAVGEPPKAQITDDGKAESMVDESKVVESANNNNESKKDNKDKEVRKGSEDGHKKEKKEKKKHKKKSKSRDRKSRSRSRSRHGKKHKKKKASHSRSRSRTRSRSDKRKKRSSSRDRKKKRSRTRSPRKSRSKDKKKEFRYDSPPKDNKAILDAQALQNMMMPAPKVTTIGAPPTTSELLQKMQVLSALQQVQASRADKVDRKLYIGNLPPNLTPQTLMDVLNSALLKMNVNTTMPGNSIISAWISPDGHYAFIEFRTPEEANNGFQLNNVAIFGQALKVGRPRTYQATQSTQALSSPLGSALSLLNPALASLLPAANANSNAPAQAPAILKVHPPSKVIVLKNLVQLAELEIDEEFQDIQEDIRDECSKYGTVISLKIPRPEPGKVVPGLGKIFVEFATLDQAKEAKKALTGKLFAERTVEAAYFSEEKYANTDLTDDSATA